jgi:hypothetical protein
MVQLIQIKRSLNTAVPSSLANGELAYTANGDVLYIGSAGSIVPISGARNPGTLTANQAMVVNATSYMDVIKTANLYIGSATVNAINSIANSTVLGASSNSELVTSWAIKTYIDTRTGGILSIGDGLTTNATHQFVLANNGITVNSTGVFVKANNGITANSTGLFVTQGNGTTVNSTGVHVLAGNAQLVSNSTGVWIDETKINHNNLQNYDANRHVDHTAVSMTAGNGLTGGGTIAATRTLSVVAGTGVTVNATGVHIGQDVGTAAAVTFGDVTISGNLTIAGAMTDVSSTNLVVEDPLVQFANGNLTTDVLDVGFYGSYGNSTVTQYTGLYRDASNSAVWTLFNTQKAPTTTVDTSNNTYAIASLLAGLQSFGLTSNATNLNLTANSTLTVAIAANTLSLSSALGVSSGGTGTGTFTTNGVLYGNGTGALQVTAAGTDGKVLTSVSGVPTFTDLDGGSF